MKKWDAITRIVAMICIDLLGLVALTMGGDGTVVATVITATLALAGINVTDYIVNRKRREEEQQNQ